MPQGYIFKRCGCRHPDTGRPLGGDCPKLRRPTGAWSADHGQWFYQIELPRVPGAQRRQLRRGGYTNQRDTAAELDQARELIKLAGRDPTRRAELAALLLEAVRTGQPLPPLDTVAKRIKADVPLAGAPTLAEYLTKWLDGLQVDPSTIASYRGQVRVHLIPHLGEIRIDKLRPRHVREMINAIQERNQQILDARASKDPEVRASVRGRRITGPATRQRIRATLRKALNDAIADELITGPNPASYVRTPAERALPIVWEPERVARWRATGVIPGPVMVWTEDQTRQFLDYASVHDPDLYPLLHFIAYRGPRRGEACGLLEAEVRLRANEVTINNQIRVRDGALIQKPPKSRAGNRDLIVDTVTAQVLTAYKSRKARHKLATGADWPDTGLFFVQRDGQPWHPDQVTQRFRRLVKRAGLPPIRLHDLRHGAASLALSAGVDIKVVQEQLGHSTSTLTRDTYQSVVKKLHHDAADAVAKILGDRKTA